MMYRDGVTLWLDLHYEMTRMYVYHKMYRDGVMLWLDLYRMMLSVTYVCHKT